MNAFGGVGFSTGHFKTKYHLGVTLFKANILSSDLSWVFYFSCVHLCSSWLCRQHRVERLAVGGF